VDTFSSLVRVMLHDQTGAARFLKDPNYQVLVDDVRAELDRRHDASGSS
jgi:hypothetical protein